MEIPNILKAWRLTAAKQQQTFYSLLSDRQWDQLDRNHKDFDLHLKIKISLGLFAQTFVKCSLNQQNQINSTIETFLKLSGSSNLVHVGYTYVHIFTFDEKERILPLIRAKSNYNNGNYYLEIQSGKIYQSWDDFLQNNNISSSYLCYPKNGFYQKQTDDLVSIQFDTTSKKASSTLAEYLEVSAYFPFHNNLHKASISSGTKITNVIISTDLAADSLFEINDKNFFAMWLKTFINDIGEMGMETDTFISMIFESKFYSKARRFMSCIYNTSSVVNRHKIIISLMTVLFKNVIGKCQGEDYEAFLAGLNFILNMTAEINFVEAVVAKLNEKPLQIQQFFTVTNLPHENVKNLVLTSFNLNLSKKSKCDETNGVSYVLQRICKMEKTDVQYIMHPNISTKIIDFVKSVKGKMKNNSTIEFWSYVSKTLDMIFLSYIAEISKDTFSSWRLTGLKNLVGFLNEKYYNTIFNNSLPSAARKILTTLDRINDSFKGKGVEVEIFTYVLEFAQTVGCIKDEEIADVCSVVVDKFINWFDSLAVELKGTKDKLTKTDIQGIIGKIFSMLNRASVMQQLKEDFYEIYQMNRSPYLGEPVFSTNDMDLYYFCEENPTFDEDYEGLKMVENIIDFLFVPDKSNAVSIKRFHDILRITYKSTLVIFYRLHQAKKIFGFILKIDLS